MATSKNSDYWTREAKGLLRAELGRRGVTYAKLSGMLQTLGLQETERSIANKLSRGTFSFVFFLQVMRVIGVRSISLEPTVAVHGLKYSGEPDSQPER